MAIRIEQPNLATLYGRAAALIGRAQRAREQEQLAERRISQFRSIEAQRESQQIQIEQQRNMRLLDAQLDLEMYERSKRWEIDKMQLRSQVDFQREEQIRQRKLDSFDSAVQQIDKEVLAGRMTEQEAYPLKLKYEMNKMGVDAPVSLLPTGDEEDRYGVKPYWMAGRDAPEGSPMRQLYESKMQQGISGARAGTVPYYFDPTFISKYPEAARQAQEARGIFLSDEEFSDLMRTPMDTKQLGVGVQAEAPAEDRRIRVVSPEGQTGTILESELPEYMDRGFELIEGVPEGAPEGTPEIIPPATEDIVEQLEAGEAKFYKPSLRTFATMSPLRVLLERYKAKKLVRKVK